MLLKMIFNKLPPLFKSILKQTLTIEIKKIKDENTYIDINKTNINILFRPLCKNLKG
jgi:hypothetical protein